MYRARLTTDPINSELTAINAGLQQARRRSGGRGGAGPVSGRCRRSDARVPSRCARAADADSGGGVSVSEERSLQRGVQDCRLHIPLLRTTLRTRSRSVLQRQRGFQIKHISMVCDVHHPTVPTHPYMTRRASAARRLCAMHRGMGYSAHWLGRGDPCAFVLQHVLR